MSWGYSNFEREDRRFISWSVASVNCDVSNESTHCLRGEGSNRNATGKSQGPCTIGQSLIWEGAYGIAY
jgi:hypothetical protein